MKEKGEGIGKWTIRTEEQRRIRRWKGVKKGNRRGKKKRIQRKGVGCCIQKEKERFGDYRIEKLLEKKRSERRRIQM